MAEDYKSKAILHLKNNHSGHSNYVLCGGPFQIYNHRTHEYEKSSYKEIKNGACYAGIGETNYEFIALGYYCSKGDSAAKNYLSWIFGEKSPWRSLFVEPVEFIEDDDFIYGFFLGEKFIKKANFKFLKNFMIATRAYNEFPEHIQMWDVLVQNGIPEDRAFFYAGRYVMYEGKPYNKMNQNTNHWAWDTDEPDFNAIEQSKPNLDAGYTNRIFAKYGAAGFGTPHANKIIKEYHGGPKTTMEAMLKMDKDYVNGNLKLS